MGALILWGLMDSPFVRRVAVALSHYCMDWERRPLSVFRDAEAMRRVSPLGRAPVLALANGRMLTDSRTILEWLDEEVAPERRLTPEDDGQRLDMLEIEAVDFTGSRWVWITQTSGTDSSHQPSMPMLPGFLSSQRRSS